MTSQVEGQMSIFDLDLWCGKTYPEHSQVESRKEKTSESSLKSARGLKSQTPLYLDLRRENGRISDASWEMGGALPGRYGMHAFTESHNGVGESRLSAILQDKVPPKYYLSARACRGILARAEKRGKMARIPEVLKKALEWQGVDENYRELVRSVSKNEPGSRGGREPNIAPAYGIDMYNQQANLETMNALRTNAGGDNYPIAAQPIRERKR